MDSRRFWKIDSNEGASVLTVRAPEGEVILLSGLKLKGAAGDAIPDGSISKPHPLFLRLLTRKTTDSCLFC
ncbi:MAG: hypothetical protein K1060chlam2_01389 [Chlamydiae bacterium]|nr:hypothetical protein [Chlamydiota bacterium]